MLAAASVGNPFGGNERGNSSLQPLLIRHVTGEVPVRFSDRGFRDIRARDMEAMRAQARHGCRIDPAIAAGDDNVARPRFTVQGSVVQAVAVGVVVADGSSRPLR